jgi:hypothetical protein
MGTTLYDRVLRMDARSAPHGAVEKDRAVGKAIHNRKGGQKLADRPLRKQPVSVVHALAVFSVCQAANSALAGNARMQAVFPLGRFFLVEIAHEIAPLR